jgi:hypothetical protein
MKKLVAILAASLIAPALVTGAAAPASAAAAPRDPVVALKRQFAKKTGVRVADSMRLSLGGAVLLRARAEGVMRFGPYGVNAFDLKTVTVLDKTVKSRVIASGSNFYLQGNQISKELPEGKEWVRVPTTQAGIRSMGAASLINVTDAKVLRALLATTKTRTPGGRVAGAKTVLYRGTVTLQRLAKVSQPIRALVKATQSKKPIRVSWRLWVAGDQLPRRFTSSFVLLSDPSTGSTVLTSDTRFSHWGTRTPVQAPPASTVIDVNDLESGEELAEDLSGQTLVPLGDPYEGLSAGS